MAQQRQFLVSSLELSEINLVLSRISERLDQMEGLRGTPKFHARVDLNGNPISNAAAAVDPGDAVVKAQLDELGERVTSGLSGKISSGSEYTMSDENGTVIHAITNQELGETA